MTIKRVWRISVVSAAVSMTIASPAWAGQVTNAGDNPLVDGTLRHEIFNAVDGEVITFDSGINPTLTTGSEIPIDENITIRGQGMTATTITGPADDRVFSIPNAHTVSIEDVEISGGDATNGTNGDFPSESGGDGESGGALLFDSGLLRIDSEGPQEVQEAGAEASSLRRRSAHALTCQLQD